MRHVPERLRRTVAIAFVLLSAALLPACKRAPSSSSSPASPSSPTVRLYVVSTLAGAMEPCGCRKDMLGGVDHAAALIAAGAKEAPHHLVIGAGPMLFMDPLLDADRKTQDQWKADAIATAFSDIGVAAWAPGANDFASGVGTAERLAKAAGATLLGGNVTAPKLPATKVVVVDGQRIGLAGVARPVHATGAVAGVQVGDPLAALQKARGELEKARAQILVALVAAERGEALRLAEKVPGFDVMVVGKPYDQGEGNDAPTPPVLVGGTLVVEPPNHLQAIAIVDLFVRGEYDFTDATGVAQAERRASLEQRIAALSARIKKWEQAGNVSAKDLSARKHDLEGLRAELGKLRPPGPPKEGSFFRYRLEEITEGLGSDPAVSRRMDAYYERVNDHNRKAFADRVPPAVPKGESGYLGAEECGNCHEEEHAFWQTTPHAKAYESLSVQHKEFNLDCVACHVTGYGKAGGSTVTHVGDLTSVQCEVCHGPGSRHEDDPENKALIVASPQKTLCKRCHHPPHVADDWSVDDAFPHILGKGHGKP